jgi:hypothetical protein
MDIPRGRSGNQREPWLRRDFSRFASRREFAPMIPPGTTATELARGNSRPRWTTRENSKYESRGSIAIHYAQIGRKHKASLFRRKKRKTFFARRG